MGVTPEEAALGVIQVANEHMARALRVISVQRGVDPQGYTLVSFGGAGGLHVCALAEALQMHQALVPVHAGVLSALGMLATRPGRQLSHTMLGPLAEMEEAKLEQAFKRLAAEGRAALEAEAVPPETVEASYSMDLRYCGQSYTLNVPWSDIAGAMAAFGESHAARYGHRMDVSVELVNLRVGLYGPAVGLCLEEVACQGEVTPVAEGRVYGLDKPVPIFAREALAEGQQITGPALVTEAVATTWLAPGWRCEVDKVGDLLLERRP